MQHNFMPSDKMSMGKKSGITVRDEQLTVSYSVQLLSKTEVVGESSGVVVKIYLAFV